MLKGVLPKTRAVTLAAVVVLLFLVTHFLYSSTGVPAWHITNTGPRIPNDGNSTEATGSGSQALPCRNLPGANDVVVIMRTGATEIQDKLPIHFDTTFQCYPDFIIFSDYAERINGHRVYDVLGSVDRGLKESNDDFEIYLRLQQHGRAGLHEEELSGKASFEGSKSGKNENPGWKLDKWKFLPMMQETLNLRPDKRWYLFVESDSYPVWSNILQWLEKMDPEKPLYAGSEVQIGPDIFAHGGSVFVMSKSAIEKGAEIYANELNAWHSWTAGHWAGDCVLGKALKDAGVGLTWSWPMFQGGHPEKMDFTERKGYDKKLWCAPALSYHHFAESDMQRMWQFEQDWIQSHVDQAAWTKRWLFGADYSHILEHRQVFKALVSPNISSERNEWNNLSPNLLPNTAGKHFGECKSLCESIPDCLQFSAGAEGCSVSMQEVMLGQPWGEIKSGWMIDRVKRWIENLDRCRGYEGWTVT